MPVIKPWTRPWLEAKRRSLAACFICVSPTWLVASDDEASSQDLGCAALGIPIEVYSGSRLVALTEGRLELERGRQLQCERRDARPVVAALERALQHFPRQRLRRPVRVHLDPRLPPGQAPVLGIEVHISSREILVRRAALLELDSVAWRHELFHTMAAPIPGASSLTRRLWTTLEEGLVAYLTLVSTPTQSAGGLEPVAWPEPELADWETLAMAGYDPHPLAVLFTRELALAEPRLGAAAALDCLVAAPDLEHASDTLRESARRFVSRCPEDAARLLGSAVARWLPEPLSPWSSAGTGEAAAPPRNR